MRTGDCTQREVAVFVERMGDGEDSVYSLATGLYELGLSRREIVDFYGFIDQILRLSRAQEKQFKFSAEQLQLLLPLAATAGTLDEFFESLSQ